MRLIRFCAVVVLAMAVVACTKPKQTQPEQPPASAGTTEGSGATTSGIGEGAGAGAGTMTAQQQALAALQQKSVIYFDYDSSEIKPQYMEVVNAHAGYLTKYPSARVRLEGNTDERGSREYNIGLGERRAQAVRQALALQGVADAQLMTVSYGEERPAVPGSDESAYAQNRRVELAYP